MTGDVVNSTSSPSRLLTPTNWLIGWLLKKSFRESKNTLSLVDSPTSQQEHRNGSLA